MSTQDVRITSTPDKSAEAVAFELWDALRHQHGGETLETKLKLFVVCRQAVRGISYNINGLT